MPERDFAIVAQPVLPGGDLRGIEQSLAAKAMKLTTSFDKLFQFLRIQLRSEVSTIDREGADAFEPNLAPSRSRL